eukprot:PhF_6_TR41729/c0_g1_i1/m.63317
MYEPLKGLIASTELTNRTVDRTCAAIISSVVGTVAAHPADLVKVVYIATPNTEVRYSKICYNVMIHHQMFRGLSAAMQRAALSGAISIGSYDHVKSWLRQNNVSGSWLLGAEGLPVVSSWICGLLTVAFTAPLETVKIRMMTRTAGKGTLYYLNLVARERGVGAL